MGELEDLIKQRLEQTGDSKRKRRKNKDQHDSKAPIVGAPVSAVDDTTGSTQQPVDGTDENGKHKVIALKTHKTQTAPKDEDLVPYMYFVRIQPDDKNKIVCREVVTSRRWFFQKVGYRFKE